jgi:hypothetical protein
MLLNFIRSINLFTSLVKKILLEKLYVIKLYKIHKLVHEFGWLTWFAGLVSLTFYVILSIDIG